MEELIQINELAVNYYTYAGKVQSVRDITFSIKKNEILAIVGESGSGKSVTAKSLMGLIESPGIIDSGEIVYNNKNILKFNNQQWQNYRGNDVSMIFQDALAALNPTQKIKKQLSECLTNHLDNLSKQDIEQRCLEAIEEVGIVNPKDVIEKYPHELSGGMRQRVMIAMAIINRPKLLIADEPTTSLDVTTQAQILDLIKKLQSEFDMSVLIITHDMGVVSEIADRVNVMYAGKIIEQGDVFEIFETPRHPYTWALLNSIPKLDYEENSKLVSIEGAPPDMSNPPSGCPFFARCPSAMKICKSNFPTQFNKSTTHRVSCWLEDERANRDKNFRYKVGDK